MQILRFNGEAVVKRERESLPSGGDLELGLGINGGCGALIKEEHGRVVFTRAQSQEFLFQGTVFRYLRWGLPVPINLVFPIWNSVVCSSKVGVHRRFPSLAILFGFGIPSMMNDPEPGRCRRTDGKKWRCLEAAVPQNKYCERHLNANRSRKHVEASQHALKPSVPTVSTSLDLMAPCSHPEKRALGMLEDGSSTYNGNGDWKSKGKSVVGDRNGTKKSRSSIHKSTNISDTNVSNLGNNGSFDASFSPGFGFLPKGILQHSNATVCTRLDLDHKIPEGKETEPQRCKRTDGKKWRCRRDAAPNKTCCEVHMLRGSKRKLRDVKRARLESNMVIDPQSSNPNVYQPSKVENKINLNTDLDLSIKGGNSSSSEATFVTDDSTATLSD